MAFEYKGTYYPTLAAQRAGILRDEYKSNPQGLKAFQTIAKAQTPTNSRNVKNQSAVDLQTWEVAKAFEKASRPAPAPRRPAPRPAPAPAPVAKLQISDEAKAYRAESERILKEAQDLRAKFSKEEEQAKAARELQQKLFIESQQGVASQIQKEREAFQSAETQRQANIEAEFQRTKAYDLEKAQTERARQQNIARAARSANVGIAPAGSAEPGGTTVQRPTGTQVFKRRPLQIKPTAYSALAIGNTANLNV